MTKLLAVSQIESMQLLLTVAIELVTIAFTLLLAVEFIWGIYERWQDVAARTRFSPSFTLWNDYYQIFLDESTTAASSGVVEVVSV